MARKRKFDGAGCIVVLVLLGIASQNLDVVLPASIGIFAILVVWYLYRAEREKKWLGGLQLSDLDNLSGEDFERWITSRLKSDGIQAKNIQHRGDFGIDVIAKVHGVQIGIQAKRYSKNVGNDAVQQALAGSGYHDCHAAAVVTQSGFTKAAVAQAQRARMPISLIGREEITKLSFHITSLAESLREG